MSLGCVLLGLVISTLIGGCVVFALWPPEPRTRGTTCLKAALAVGLGLGITACGYELRLLLWPHDRWTTWLMDVLLLVAAGALLVWRQSARVVVTTPTADTSTTSDRDGLTRWLGAAVVTGGIIWCVAVYAAYLHWPQGDWDAYMAWNLKARFMDAGGYGWPSKLDINQRGRPLLLPCTVARLWTYQGAQSNIVPAIVGGVFGLSTLGVLYGTVATVGGRVCGALAALALLASPVFAASAAEQLADVPLACFMAATIGLWILAAASPRHAGALWILAGMTGGCALLSKNEGLPYVVFVLAVILLIRCLGPRGKVKGYRVTVFLAGLAPFVCFFLTTKFILMAGSSHPELLGNHNLAAIVEQLTDPNRYGIILTETKKLFPMPANLILILAPLYAVLAGLNRDRRVTGVLVGPILVLVLMILLEFCIYLLAPGDLRWWVSLSADRLFIQLWPSALMVMMLLFRSHSQASKSAQR